ncbi:MAG TPA: GNAT family N-acetyltransferase [Longimicrobium sp.]|nr:GNAT family N-acetyltransferase [Longimicrobium sp.]
MPNYLVDEFRPYDARAAEFAALRERVGYAGPDDPLPPDARCLLMRGADGPLARVAYTRATDLHGAPGRTGLLGWYEAVDAAAGPDLLRAAAMQLFGRGARRVLGPLNGSTWGRYRLALPPEPGEGPAEPSFLSEPWNPPEYPRHFAQAGFRVAAAYESAIVRDLSAPEPRRDELAERLRARGVTIRPLALDDFDAELESIFGLTREAFAESPFYSPIDFPEFLARYAPLRPLLDPELVRLAHDGDGRLLGYVFAFPDRLQPGRVVLKTLATAAAARGLGLGTFLTDEVRRIAHERGDAAVIHALMHADNTSVRISRHSGEVFRRYALYAWAP